MGDYDDDGAAAIMQLSDPVILPGFAASGKYSTIPVEAKVVLISVAAARLSISKFQMV